MEVADRNDALDLRRRGDGWRRPKREKRKKQQRRPDNPVEQGQPLLRTRRSLSLRNGRCNGRLSPPSISATLGIPP